MQNKLIAEALGTFTLALAVLTSIQMGGAMVATPVLAGLVLALFVYTIGSKSGSHINPAVTLGLWSINKIKTNDAVAYIVAQILGALVAFGVASTLMDSAPTLGMAPESMSVFIAELIGALLFGFGIAAVVYGKVRDDMSGMVIGGYPPWYHAGSWPRFSRYRKSSRSPSPWFSQPQLRSRLNRRCRSGHESLQTHYHVST